MTLLAGAALQPLVWSSDPVLFAEAVVEGSFTNADLRALGAVFEAEADTYQAYGDSRCWGLRGLAHSLCEFRWERKAFGGREDLSAVVILAQRKEAIRENARRGVEGFQRAFARFAPREEALRRAARDFNPVPTFDSGDFLERWWALYADMTGCYDMMSELCAMQDFLTALRGLQIKELAQVRAEAEKLAGTTRYDGLRDYYQFIVREIDRLNSDPVGQAA